MTKQSITAAVCAVLALGSLMSLNAADEKPKPYPLKKCIVSDELLEGSGMTPYQFIHQGQEIKLCCKSCLEDFDKEPAKYLKKLQEAGK